MTSSPNPINRGEGISSSVTWQLLWAIIAPRIWIFFACFFTAIIIAIAYLIEAPSLYQSTATVQVEMAEQRAFKSTDNNQAEDDLKGEDVIKTIEQNFQNYSLYVNVVTDPVIANDLAFLVGYHTGSTPPTTPELAAWVQANTKVAARHGTRLIDITVYHQNPGMAQKLAEAVIRSFSQVNGQSQSLTQQSALKFLAAQSEDVKANLQKSEDALEIYKDTLLLKDRVEDQQRVVDALRQRYRDKHPQLIQARMLLADLMQTFDADFKKVIANSGVEATYWAAKSNELSSAAPEDRIPTELKLVEARSEVLQKQVDTESALFAPTEIRLVEPAPYPLKPSWPKKLIVLFIGAAAGTFFGAAAILVVQAVDSSIQTPTEAEALLGLPLLGVIPRIATKKKSASNHELIVSTDPSSAAAEGFRSLRAVVNLLGKASEHRSILFTSALPGEGKTFVSSNYALALAQAGLSTLLVDTDLRRPTVHTRFNLENKIGFVEVVTQDLDLNQAVHFHVTKNLNVLTAGGKCPNPAELLAGAGFKEVLTKALMNYDRIVFDCSPVNLVSDSLLIAGHVDTVCLVVRAGTTSRQGPVYAVNMLRRIGKEPSGFVINAVPPRQDRHHLGYKGKDAGAYREIYS